MPSGQVEEVARRQDAERTSIAQARAQSATELSTSRRLKADLARAFAVQQRQAKSTADVPFTPFSGRPLLDRHGGGGVGAGVGVGFDRRGFGEVAGVSMSDMAAGTMPNGEGGRACQSICCFWCRLFCWLCEVLTWGICW